MSARWIAHLDMDAFFASVELLRYPELRGRPVVVGGRRRHDPSADGAGARAFARLGDYAGRGVVTTATYEARVFGIHSGMGLMKAGMLAPDAVLLPSDFDRYRDYSRRFKSAVARVAPVIEDRGIDEIYIDLSRFAQAAESAAVQLPERIRSELGQLAMRIKDEVRQATGLTCSIGITPNKLLSKMCSEFGKPDGLTILDYADIPERIWPLAVRRINGIGPKAGAILEDLGIGTIGELAAADVRKLAQHFGVNYAAWLHDAANGRDERPVVTVRDVKSISRETTFDRDLHVRADRATLSAIFTALCEQVAADLVRKGYWARTIGVKLRFDDFRISTRELTLPAHTQDASVIRRWAGRCLKKQPLERRLRLLGVRATGLCPSETIALAGPGWVCEEPQLNLFRTPAP